MSALVVTILIGVVWAAMTALGYLRGGWREVVTLAAMLLSYAMLSEWAAPNGRDLVGVFGGDLYRSSTVVAFLYLLGGTLLLGYFGGSRLPRPVPLSATERFAGGGIGFFNGALLVALALRTLQAYTFAPGDSAVLAGTPLAGGLIGNIGYGIGLAMLAGAVAPFLSYFLLRGPRDAAEQVEAPSRARAPHAPEETAAAFGPPRPVTAPTFSPPPAAPHVPRVAPTPTASVSGTAPRAAPPGAAPALPRRAADASLIPAHPALPPAVSAPMLPTPTLPPARPQGDAVARGADASPTAPLDLPAPAPAEAVPAPPTPGAPRVSPPGSAVPAAQSLPTLSTGDSALPSEAAGDASTNIAPPVPGAEPAFAPQQPPPPSPQQVSPPSRAMPEHRYPALLTDTEGMPLVLPATAPTPDVLVTSGEPEADTASKAAPPSPAPLSRTGTDNAEGEPAGATRVANVRQPSPALPPSQPLSLTGPGTMRRPVQPGPRMHPCPVCDYPVRDEAHYCPNCGGVQPLPAKTGG